MVYGYSMSAINKYFWNISDFFIVLCHNDSYVKKKALIDFEVKVTTDSLSDS